jgi:two-component system copper resistance phosphate regulon response regulator CusR
VRILVVEDHPETRQLLQRVLREAGHFPEGAADLASARRRLAEGGYEALILDWMLPDGSGAEYCREMRARQESIPILILTARGGVEDRVAGLDAGADDYLRKPFAVAELLARVRALTRRGPRLLEPTVSLGSVEVHLGDRRVRAGGRNVPLTAREFAILEILLRNRGRPVSRSTILLSVWGEENESACSSLEVLIARLRRKLAPGGGEGPIRTHRGFGYAVGGEP